MMVMNHRTQTHTPTDIMDQPEHQQPGNNANDADENDTNTDISHDNDDIDLEAIAKGGVACPFPWKIHKMLKVTAEEGLQDIVSWCSHGRAFAVHKPKDFASQILQRYV